MVIYIYIQNIIIHQKLLTGDVPMLRVLIAKLKISIENPNEIIYFS